ncbi:MAG TPA: type II toxin-antitoxin system VapC family toxin [Isosphaeraceae bacterium]|nr:type II toxin-antitoxin system VapC family toxin [Isosphaeraceae bacterium]
MNGYLLDTNHLSDAIRPVSRVRERIEQARRSGWRVGTCVPALCELEVALHRVGHRGPSRRTLGHLLTRVRIWPIDPEVAGHYGIIFHELRSRGRVLSQVDLILAALTRVMDLTLLTADQDFEALPDLRRENWLSEA